MKHIQSIQYTAIINRLYGSLTHNEADSELKGSRKIVHVNVEAITHYTQQMKAHANIWLFYSFLTAFTVRLL